MTFAFQQDVPIDINTYRQIVTRLGDQPASGLIVHLAIEVENGLRYIDVWESQEAHTRFVDERLHQAIHPILMKKFGATPPEPPLVPLSVTDVWRRQ